MVRVSSAAKLRPWSELTAKMVMGVVPWLVTIASAKLGVVRILLSSYTFRQFAHHPPLDGRNRARVIAESLARITAAIRITSVHWRSYLPLKTQKLVLVDPAFVALRFESRDWRSLVQRSFHVTVGLRNGLREL